MILITGATGHLGGQVLENLLKKTEDSKLAVLVRDENKAAHLKAKGVELRVADYHNKESITKAMTGIDKVILISSSDFNDRLGQHKNVIDAAKNAGVNHFVYTGVSMNDVNNSVLKDFMIDHYQTEDYIKASGMNYTLLQHNLYTDVLPMFLGENVLETGVFFPAGQGKVPFALRSEMAEAIANVLLSEDHLNQTYRINSSESYDMSTVAEAISKATGKDISYIDPEVTQFEGILKSANVPEHLIGMTIGFATAIKNGDFDFVSNHLEQLLGRKPAGAEAAMKELFGKN